MSTEIKFKNKLPKKPKTTHSAGEIWEYQNFIGNNQYYMLAVDILTKTWYLVYMGGFVDKKITVDYPGDLLDKDFRKLWNKKELVYIKKKNLVEITTEED